MNQSEYFNNVIKQNALPVPKPLLPPEYQQVEYLESSGTQYMQIGMINEYTYFEIDFELVSFVNNNYGINYNFNGLFGTNSLTVNGARVDTKVSFYNTPGLYVAVHNTTMGDTSILVNTKYNLYVSPSETKLNGVTISSATAGNITGNKAAGLFAVYHDPSINACAAKIYRFNSNVRSLYPCYRKSDSKPGMYDITNDVFYTNQGTGEFTVGPNV